MMVPTQIPQMLWLYPSNKLRMDMANNCTLAVMKLGKDEANRDVVVWYFLCFLTIETR